MARGTHRSPQTTKYGKRIKSRKKTMKMIEQNRAVLSNLK